MALFDKRTPYQRIVDLFNELSEEEKSKIKNELFSNGQDEPSEEVQENTEEESVNSDVENVEEENSQQEVEQETSDEESSVEVDNEANEENNDEEVIAEAEENKEDAQESKLEAFWEEWATYKEKIDAILERFDDLERPAESAGLAKQKSVDLGEDDDNLSAFEYAQKYAKY